MPEGAGTALPAASPAASANRPAPAVALASEAERPWYKSPSTWAALVALALTIAFAARLIYVSHETAAASKAASAPFDFFAPEDMDCDYLVDEAVRISGEQDGFDAHLLDVRTLEIAADYRQTYLQPSGAGESKVLVCSGVGVFDTGDKVPVKITGSVDADLNVWVYYKAV